MSNTRILLTVPIEERDRATALVQRLAEEGVPTEALAIAEADGKVRLSVTGTEEVVARAVEMSRDLDQVEEASRESFPASDPPAQY